MLFSFLSLYNNQKSPGKQKLTPAQSQMDNSCSICHRKNAQLLMLSCGHDPCIDCAASHYFTGTEYRKQFQYLREANYWCQICYDPTLIDHTSIQELVDYVGLSSRKTTQIGSSSTLGRSKSYQRKSIAKKHDQGFHSPPNRIPNKNESKQKKKLTHRHQGLGDPATLLVSSQEFRSNLVGHPQYNQTDFKNSLKQTPCSNNFLFQSNKSGPSLVHPVCPKHSDELQSYYCFTCSCSICVECALHGSHMGHQVEAIRKAGNRLKSNYQKLITQSQKYRASLEGNVKDLEKMINNYRVLNQKQRVKIRQKFAELSEILADKEKAILLQIERIENESLNSLFKQKCTYEDQLSLLKIKRKKLKYCLNISPVEWNISEMETTKNQLKILCEGNLVQALMKKTENSIKYVETQLLIQALDTIQDLVSTFKVSSVEGEKRGN